MPTFGPKGELLVLLTGAGVLLDHQHSAAGDGGATLEVGGVANFSEFLGHVGDADTYWQYQADRATLVCGGVTMIDAFETGTNYLNLLAGMVGINETANANMSIGLTIDQGAADDEIFNARSSDVGAVLAGAETNTYLNIRKVQGSSGGAHIAGLKDADGNNRQALSFLGYLAEDTSTAKTTGAHAIIEMAAYQTDGSAIENTIADGNLLALRTYRGGAYVTVSIWDEDGDYYYDGTLNNYDDYDDALAVWDLSHVLGNQYNKIIEYNAEQFEAMGIISEADDDGRRMVSTKRMTALLMGAVGQLYERCQRYELALSSVGLLPQEA